MRISRSWIGASAVLAAMMISSIAQAAKTYQVTGVVTALTAKVITVQKPNDEKWEIDRDDATKVTGDLKVGAKVTIEYKMAATTVEVKTDK